MTEPLETVVQAAHEVAMLTNDRITGALDELGLTHATAQALWAIDPERPAPSMKVLADRLYCNAPNLSFIVNQLTERGFVTRDVAPGDRRSRVVVLTGQGRSARERVVRAVLDASPFAGCAPEEIRFLAGVLQRVLGHGDGQAAAPGR